jgi:hypothetical protein
VHGEFDFDNDSALGYSCFKVQFSILAISKDLQVQSSLPKKTWFSSSLGTISFILTLGLWLLVPGVAATGDNQAAGPPVGAMTDRDPSAYQGMTADQIARVKKGEIVILDQPQSFEGRQLVAAAFMFNQDLNTLWTLMLQGWRQEEYMPRLERSPLIKKWDNGHLIEFQLKVAGIGVKFRLLGAFEPSRYYCSWKLDPGIILWPATAATRKRRSGSRPLSATFSPAATCPNRSTCKNAGWIPAGPIASPAISRRLALRRRDENLLHFPLLPIHQADKFFAGDFGGLKAIDNPARIRYIDRRRGRRK